MNDATLDILKQIATSLSRIDAHLAGNVTLEPCDFDRYLAFSWRKTGSRGQLHEVKTPKLIKLDNLVGVDAQKQTLVSNTEQFLAGFPANHALLWGAKGTGKSSIIKGLLERYGDRGLRVIEVDRHDLVDIPDIAEHLRGSDKKFILFCDDLSFEAQDVSYKALKVALDGGMTAIPDNLLIYATSNRRHLLPEMMSDNLQSQVGDMEVHYADAIEEKISLSERFGIWLSFYSFNQDAYLGIVRHWVEVFGLEFTPEVEKDALTWAWLRASKSGRSAYQFVVDLLGKRGMQAVQPTKSSM